MAAAKPRQTVPEFHLHGEIFRGVQATLKYIAALESVEAKRTALRYVDEILWQTRGRGRTWDAALLIGFIKRNSSTLLNDDFKYSDFQHSLSTVQRDQNNTLALCNARQRFEASVRDEDVLRENRVWLDSLNLPAMRALNRWATELSMDEIRDRVRLAIIRRLKNRPSDKVWQSCETRHLDVVKAEQEEGPLLPTDLRFTILARNATVDIHLEKKEDPTSAALLVKLDPTRAERPDRTTTTPYCGTQSLPAPFHPSQTDPGFGATDTDGKKAGDHMLSFKKNPTSGFTDTNVEEHSHDVLVSPLRESKDMVSPEPQLRRSHEDSSLGHDQSGKRRRTGKVSAPEIAQTVPQTSRSLLHDIVLGMITQLRDQLIVALRRDDLQGSARVNYEFVTRYLESNIQFLGEGQGQSKLLLEASMRQIENRLAKGQAIDRLTKIHGDSTKEETDFHWGAFLRSLRSRGAETIFYQDLDQAVRGGPSEGKASKIADEFKTQVDQDLAKPGVYPKNFLDLSGNLSQLAIDPVFNGVDYCEMSLLFRSTLSYPAVPGSKTKGKNAARDDNLRKIPTTRGSCHFHICAQRGSSSRWHVDLLGGTWVRCIKGIKLWFLCLGLDQEELEEFSRQGEGWIPPPHKVYCVVLRPGDTLVMPHGQAFIHGPITLTDCLMDGGMFWTFSHFPLVLKHLEFTIRCNKIVTNEDPFEDLDDILNRSFELWISYLNNTEQKSKAKQKQIQDHIETVRQEVIAVKVLYAEMKAKNWIM